ncbi:hypothetical protein CRENBAI_011486 [Crenichthys baileyi]|uniref:Uncharacterized protein n=1 Tax=Crenichthys baileyi TaxID=28760 RepID=A0AAV9QVN7_9TELE
MDRGSMDGWMDEWVDGWMEGRMDGMITLNQDIDIEHIPPTPNAMNPPFPQGHSPHISSTPEKLMKTHSYSTSSTHSPCPSTPAASCRLPHSDGKARSPQKMLPQSSPTIATEQTPPSNHAHNVPPDPTPRWDKFTRQEVPPDTTASTPPSPPDHPANASRPSPPVNERETYASRVTRPGQSNRPR